MKFFLQTNLSLCRKLIKAIPPLVMVLLLGGSAYAEKYNKAKGSIVAITVTGNVKDAAGEPLPGANVIIKGTKVGT
ncbi:MAG: hypothetical protein R2822_21235 [Spirosomataceae bacterium]